MEPIIVKLKDGSLYSFVGKFRRDLERDNWHYYEGSNGEMYHFKKDQMASVISSAETFNEND